MKVVAINSSARKNGNTSILIEKVFEPLREKGVNVSKFNWQAILSTDARLAINAQTKKINAALLKVTSSTNVLLK